MAEAKPESIDILAIPLAPLVFRSGQPFGEAGQTGGLNPLRFPLPGSMAGGVRAAWCEVTGRLPRDDQHVHSVLDTIHVQGPLRCTQTGNDLHFWYPKPVNAEIDEGWLYGRWPTTAAAAAAAEQGGCDLPSGLLPLTRRKHHTKLASGEPESASWWNATALVAWLASASANQTPALTADQCMPDLPADRETHIAVDASRQVEASRLFVNETLNFRQPLERSDTEQGLWMRLINKEKSSTHPKKPPREHKNLAAIAGKPWRLGADGAAAWFKQMNQNGPEAHFQDLANQLKHVKQGSIVCLYLATPACFARNGWYPDGLAPKGTDGEANNFLKPRPAGSAADKVGSGDELPLVGRLVGWPDGSQVRLLAAAVEAYVPYSGWKQRPPKAETEPRTRPGRKNAEHPVTPVRDSALQRLVPAGSLYWFEVTQWKNCERHFWTNLMLQSCCRAEHARDGLGLAVYALVKR